MRTVTKLLGIFLALAMLVTAAALPRAAGAQSIGITVSFGPPAIPYYVQPPAPGPNYIWTPGYWAYDPSYGYYWVPGTWVLAPQYGLLWTPGYWAWNGVAYVFTSGYWAPLVGWYGGIDYGYGYYGKGYYGGRWQGRTFVYNTAVTNVNRTYITNVYNDPRVVVHNWNRVSYNGGRGGISARPSADVVAIRDHRVFGPTSVQMQHARFAATDRSNFVVQNHGRPGVPAMTHPIQHAYAAPAHYAAPEHNAGAMQHAYMPQEHRAAPQEQHFAASQHYAAPHEHAAPQPHYAAPQQPHYAAPQGHGGPQEHGGPQGGGHGGGGHEGGHQHG